MSEENNFYLQDPEDSKKPDDRSPDNMENWEAELKTRANDLLLQRRGEARSGRKIGKPTGDHPFQRIR